MSTRFVGRFVSTRVDAGGQRMPLLGFRVRLLGPPPLFGSGALGDVVVTDAAGLVDFSYRRDPSQVGAHRHLELVVTDAVGRRIPFDTADGREVMDDVDDERLGRAADYVVREADAYGLLATLGTGHTVIQSPNGFGWGFRPGNRVTTLMDVDGFVHAARLMREAKQSLAVSQLFFPIPVVFVADATVEDTKLIFEFAGGPPDMARPRVAGAGAGDARPERLLLEAGDRGVEVRILLNDVQVPLFIKIAAGLIAFPFAGTLGVAEALTWLDENYTDTDEVTRYFRDAGATRVRAAAFEQPLLTSAGVMHAKLMVADWTHALSLGSPFGQSYVDSIDHAIDAPMRGSSTGLPKHDAGFAITGPAVAHLQETLKLMWDTVQPEDKLVSFPGPTEPIGDVPAPPAPPVAAPGRADPRADDGVCGVQIVRTLSSGRFKGVAGIPEDGEKGILEAYQRAIAAAEDFIYLETQYFTNDAIGEALVGALRAKRGRPGKPDLQVILVCNIAPDVPLYPFKQRRLIHRIREAIGEDVHDPRWFGVFTRWSHDPPDAAAQPPRPGPRLLPIYVHAKAAVVDNAWATIGSANLDGLSLDSMLLWDKLNAMLGSEVFRQQRAIEVNGCFLNPDGDNPVVDLLRRKLWAEHLGFVSAPGVPNLEAPQLALAQRPADGWLGLWNRMARATLQRAIDTPRESFAGFARVLPWPKRNCTYKTPRKHLDALGIKTYRLQPMKSTRSFLFGSGSFDPKSRVEIDID